VSLKTLRLAGLCSVIAMTAASGCGDGSSASGTQATPSETHAKRNREMLDYMKDQAKEASPSK
jgi:hypothetical protein